MRFLLKVLSRMAPKLGFAGVRVLARVLAACMWYVVPSRRKLATEAIAKHLNKPVAEARAIARASFTHNFRSFLELFLVGRVDERFRATRLAEVPMNGMLDALEYDGPIVGVTAHLGAWELLAGILGLQVAPQRDALVVVRRNKNADLHDVITQFRSSTGATVVDHRKAVFTVLKALKRKGLAAFLVDHNCPRSEAIFLPFLNDIAAVNMGPAVLAVRSNAAVLPVFMLRDEKGGYVFHVQDMLKPEQLEGTREEKIRQVAEFYTQAVAQFVTEHPEQWFWMHKRWKTRPE